MLCNEFRELIFERLSGELTPQQDAACAQHEHGCVICRAELAQFRDVNSKLRAGWPSEEPLPISVVLPQIAARNWIDVSALWFSRASAGLVAACLLLMLVARPSVQVGRGGMQIAFGPAPAQAQQVAAAAPAVTEAQVKAMVQAAVDAQMTQTQARPVSAKPAAQAPDVTQVAMQVRRMERNEATLWQAVQQHGVYLETLWNRTSDSAVRPASLAR
jgi:hypothetical protein